MPPIIDESVERILRQGRGPIYIDCREASDDDVEVIRWRLQNEGNWALFDYYPETDDAQWLCNTAQRWSSGRVEIHKCAIASQAR